MRPCVVVACPHWGDDYARAASSAGVAVSPDDCVTVSLDEGVTTVNARVSQIAAAQ